MENNFWSRIKAIVFVRLLFIVLVVVLLFLYDISHEYGMYFVLFMLVELGIILCLQYRDYRAERRALEAEPEYTDIQEDKRWIELKEREDFFALWAHQIKTPIAALRLLFQTDSVDVSQCRLEIFKIENYVEIALNYLRFDTLSSDLAFENYNLEKMIKAVVKKHAVIFINKHLSIKLDNLDFNVLTDEKWFSFCFEQILSNALKYTKEGGVSISAEEIDGDIVVCVKDNGIGIRQEDIPRLFEKGFTGYNGRMDKKASGIGLYLCKGVCDKLGHVIWVESEETVGTSVYIKIKAETVNRKALNKI